MKKVFFGALILFIFAYTYAENDFVKQGDFYFDKRNKILDSNYAIENINKAIENYQKALEQKTDEITLYKLTNAVDFKYNFLLSGENHNQEKRNIYKLLLGKIDKYCENNKNCNDSKFILYSRAILIGRFGELMNTIEAAKNGIAGKIKENAEKLLLVDDKFEDYSAYIILGRLHYKAPKIIFVLPWPDKKKSKEYLEKYLQYQPDSLTGMYYLADTLYALGEKERAKELYQKVLNTNPRENFYYEDKMAQEEVKEKIKNKF